MLSHSECASDIHKMREAAIQLLSQQIKQETDSTSNPENIIVPFVKSNEAREIDKYVGSNLKSAVELKKSNT